MMLVSADTGYPITRLFGVSPAGMNATGESDMRNYYDKVRSRQQRVLKPMLLRVVQIISEWQKLPEPFIEFRPLKQMSEKEQAELEKLLADKDQVVATTYKTYIDMGAMEPYEARYLQFGDSLDKIPVSEEEALPPVETVSEEEDGKEENNAGKEGAEGEDETEGEEGKSQGEDDGMPDGEDDSSGKKEDDPDGDKGTDVGGADDPEDIETRIAELEEKEELTAEEKKELAELKKQLEKKKEEKK
jgi:hypothetical protein